MICCCGWMCLLACYTRKKSVMWILQMQKYARIFGLSLSSTFFTQTSDKENDFFYLLFSCCYPRASGGQTKFFRILSLFFFSSERFSTLWKFSLNFYVFLAALRRRLQDTNGEEERKIAQRRENFWWCENIYFQFSELSLRVWLKFGLQEHFFLWLTKPLKHHKYTQKKLSKKIES